MKKYYYHFILYSFCYLLILWFLRLPFWQTIDTQITLFLIKNRNEFATTFFLFITHLADEKVMILVLILLSIYLGIKKQYLWCLRFILTSGLCGAINTSIKHIIQRERPLFSQLVFETSSSFPSGHSSASFSFWGTLFLYFSHSIKEPWLRMLLHSICIVLTLLIGFSRLYLGVHWFTDILGGYVTAFYTMLCINLLYKIGKEKKSYA